MNIKSLFLTGIALLISAPLYAQEESDLTDYKTGCYILKMSPNGRWMGSMAGDASVWDMETGAYFDYWTSFLGLGNAVADNGTAVGNSYDVGTFMKDGQIIFPPALAELAFCDINGITRDGSRITGVMYNPEHDGLTYVGFVADVDENGNVATPKVLPHPVKDFFRATPQFTTGVWISDDGHTVVGGVVDWRGMYSYPIIYKEDEAGNWTYTLPTESLFNPTGIEIPDNPWLGEPIFPEPEYYIENEFARQAYLEAFEAYSTGGGAYPYPEDYMTPEEYQNYVDGVEAYNDWYYSVEDDIKAYLKIYANVLRTTPSFSTNDVSLSPSGELFYSHGGVEDENGDMVGMIYSINTVTGEWKSIEAPERSLFPYQVLSDGTLIVTKGIMDVPNSYILLPGADEFILLQDYLIQVGHAELAEWIDTKFPGGNGVVLMSDDKSVISGALTPYQLDYFDWEFSDFYYSTYFIKLGAAGIRTITEEPTDGIFRVYNLQGVKVLETSDKDNLKSLGKGLYIINGKKIII